MKEFEIGDRVILNGLANALYGVTKEGSEGIITHVYDHNEISVDFYKLTSRDPFDTLSGNQIYGISKDAAEILSKSFIDL